MKIGRFVIMELLWWGLKMKALRKRLSFGRVPSAFICPSVFLFFNPRHFGGWQNRIPVAKGCLSLLYIQCHDCLHEHKICRGKWKFPSEPKIMSNERSWFSKFRRGKYLPEEPLGWLSVDTRKWKIYIADKKGKWWIHDIMALEK